MGESFRVDLDHLRCAAPRFSEASADLSAALARLCSVLADCADMCGNDKEGREFAAAYEPNRELLNEAVALASGGLGAIAECLVGTACNYAAADTTHAQSFQATPDS